MSYVIPDMTSYEDVADIQLDQFVQDYLPLVKKIAVYIKRKLPSHIEFDDLLQSGLIGLLEAKKNYRTDMGASFATYAGIRIRGSIIDSLRKNSWVSRDTIKEMKRMAEAITRIEQRLQRHVTMEEIIAELGISAEEYFRITQEINMLHITNLTQLHLDSIKADDSSEPEELLQKKNIQEQLKAVLKTLPEKEQLVLSLYYVEELTFKQIGEVLDLTEARICQLHSQSIARLRSKMNSNEKGER